MTVENAAGAPPMTNPDVTGLGALPHCVARVTAGVQGRPNEIAYGTGFLYEFDLLGARLPCLVSNKHVLQHRPWIEIGFAESLPDGRRALQPAAMVRVNAGELPIIGHPDPLVDIAVVPVGPLIDQLSRSGRHPFVLSLTKSLCITPQQIEYLHAGSDVLMVGFPNGLMDDANNLPVLRRGSLAMPYRANYQGRPDFVVDIAAFGGSSGSPVFAYYNGLEPTSQGFNLGSQAFYLIGILYAGPTISAEGKIVTKAVPTATVAITQQMIHLGYCAKISLLDDLIGPLAAMAGPPPGHLPQA